MFVCNMHGIKYDHLELITQLSLQAYQNWAIFLHNLKLDSYMTKIFGNRFALFFTEAS